MIFVGGTGRSGTTIFAKMMGLHNEIYTFPKEIRFITDPDGLINLKSALVDNWSYYQADFAIERFFLLMKKLRKKSLGGYPTLDFSSIVGPDIYDQGLNSLKKGIVGFEYNSNWVGRTNIFRKIAQKLISNNKKAAVFYPKSYYGSLKSEKEFNEIVSAWLENLIHQICLVHDCKTVLDHTPSNIIHSNFIHKILPQSKFIHMYRDPRDVITSFSKTEWGSTPLNNLRWIEDIYRKWEIEKKTLPKESFLEVRFEDYVSKTEESLNTICDFLGIGFDEDMLAIKLNKPNTGRYKKELDGNVIEAIEQSKIDKKYFYEN